MDVLEGIIGGGDLGEWENVHDGIERLRQSISASLSDGSGSVLLVLGCIEQCLLALGSGSVMDWQCDSFGNSSDTVDINEMNDTSKSNNSHVLRIVWVLKQFVRDLLLNWVYHPDVHESAIEGIISSLEAYSRDTLRQATVYTLRTLFQDMDQEQADTLLQKLFAHVRDSALKSVCLTLHLGRDHPITPLYSLLLIKPFRDWLCKQTWAFASPWLYNGKKLQTETAFGPFMQTSAFLDESKTAELYFQNSINQSPLHTLALTESLRANLNQICFTASQCIQSMLDDTECRPAILCWISAVLTSNWARSRSRFLKEHVSENGFLLNLCHSLLNLQYSRHSLELSYFTTPSRVCYREETRIVSSLGEMIEQESEKPFITPESSHEERDFFRKAFDDNHVGIICDKCRLRDLKGLRFKCGNCQDYDLCANCEQLEHQEALGLCEKTGTLFQCPLCPENDMFEQTLRAHLTEMHSDDIIRAMACPICEANHADPVPILVGTQFFAHLNLNHSSQHDPQSHTMLQVKRMLPHFRNNFQAIETFSKDFSAQQNDSGEFIHESISCSACCKNIHGVRYLCSQCPEVSLCATCQAQDTFHDPMHIFWKIRIPLKQSESIKPIPSLYPTHLLCSFQHSLESDLFFQTCHALHIGLIPVCQDYQLLARKLESLSKEDREKQSKLLLSVDVQLKNPDLLEKVFRFYHNLSLWILHDFFDNYQNDPTPFNSMPEYLFEDMVDFLMFLCQHGISTLHRENMNLLPTILRLFLQLIPYPEFARNPYLRTKFVELLMSLCPISHNLPIDTTILYQSSLMQEELVPACITMFCNLPADKLQCRYHLGRILQALPSVPGFSFSNLDQQIISCTNSRQRLVFMNKILDDLMFILEETLGLAQTISEIEQIRYCSQQWDRLERSQQNRHRATLKANRRNLRAMSMHATNSIQLLWVNSNIPCLLEICCSSQVLKRICASVHFYILELGSSKEVVNPEKCKYFPKKWLCLFLGIWMNLARHQPLSFMKAVSEDERSFHPKKLLEAPKMFDSEGIRVKVSESFSGHLSSVCEWNSELSEEFRECLHKAETFCRNSLAKMKALGEIPEEFMDPILHSIMEDPVRLPSSGMIVDRSVISRHLLSTPLDPFNRQPLSDDMLEPCPELLQRIKEFLNS